METRIPFCNSDDWNEKLATIVQNDIFHFESLANLYNLYDSFKKGENKAIKGYPTASNFNRIISFSYISKTISSDPTSFEFVGIDVPTYFNYQNSLPKIMIVGIDPLRTEQMGDNLKKNITIGTPYGLHLKRDNIYGTFLKELIEKLSLTVYLTDTFKLYFTYEGKVSNMMPQFTNPEQCRDNEGNFYKDVHQDIFAKEIEIIKPTLIVTLGKPPRQWFTNVKADVPYDQLLKMSRNNHESLFYNHIPVLPLMHLSGKAAANRKKYYHTSDNADIIETYIKLIEARLKQPITQKTA